MRDSKRYPFIPADSILGEASLRPYLPITLTYQGCSMETSGLLDTGSMVNVLLHQSACLVAVVNQDRYVPRYQYPH